MDLPLRGSGAPLLPSPAYGLCHFGLLATEFVDNLGEFALNLPECLLWLAVGWLG